MSVSTEWDATPRRGEVEGAPVDPIQSAFDLGIENNFAAMSIRKAKKQTEFFDITKKSSFSTYKKEQINQNSVEKECYLKFSPVKFPDIDEPSSPLRIQNNFEMLPMLE